VVGGKAARSQSAAPRLEMQDPSSPGGNATADRQNE